MEEIKTVTQLLSVAGQLRKSQSYTETQQLLILLREAALKRHLWYWQELFMVELDDLNKFLNNFLGFAYGVDVHAFPCKKVESDENAPIESLQIYVAGKGFKVCYDIPWATFDENSFGKNVVLMPLFENIKEWKLFEEDYPEATFALENALKYTLRRSKEHQIRSIQRKIKKHEKALAGIGFETDFAKTHSDLGKLKEKENYLKSTYDNL